MYGYVRVRLLRWQRKGAVQKYKNLALVSHRCLTFEEHVEKKETTIALPFSPPIMAANNFVCNPFFSF